MDDSNNRAGRVAWSEFDDRRLKMLVLAMFSFSKVVAEFPHHSANAVRDAWQRLFLEPEQTPVNRAIYVLGGRAKICGKCATGLRLDGRPSSASQIVAAANIILAARRLPMICYHVGSVAP